MSTDPYICRGCGEIVTGGVCCTINVCVQCGHECANTTYSRKADEHFCCLCVDGLERAVAGMDWPACRMSEARENVKGYETPDGDAVDGNGKLLA